MSDKTVRRPKSARSPRIVWSNENDQPSVPQSKKCLTNRNDLRKEGYDGINISLNNGNLDVDFGNEVNGDPDGCDNGGERRFRADFCG